MNVVSLKDYAAQKNVSYEAVRQQVVRYKDDLAGHVIRDGRQQLLDEDAVAFLDAKRMKNPVAIIQMDKDERIEALEAQVKALLAKTADQADRISALAEWKADKSLLIAEAEQSRLALQTAQNERAALQHDYDQAIETIEQTRKEAAQSRQEALEATERETQTQNLLDDERAAREAAEAEAAKLRAEANSYKKSIFGFYRKKG